MDQAELQAVRERLLGQIHRVVIGQHDAIELMLVALLSEGHVLLEGRTGDSQDASGSCLCRRSLAWFQADPIHSRLDAG
jgi:MoxR-like ATPase